MIIVEMLDLDLVFFLENYDGIINLVLDCLEVLVDLLLIELDNLGYLMINGVNFYDVIYCLVVMNYDDEVFYVCDNSFLIFCIWCVINQCLLNLLMDVCEFIQLIRVEDVDGLDLNCLEDEIISVLFFNCEVIYQVFIFDIGDVCFVVIYQVVFNGDILLCDFDNIYVLIGLELGMYIIIYLVWDECGICLECSFELMVEDQIFLVVICDDQLNVLFGGGDSVNGILGQVCLLVMEVDEGLNDNCSMVILEVRCNYW